ncbi:MAG: hypothetical protein KDI63_12135 [Gammaproteobacteria bacterium]|nr:hypothetical protein [Gammaproteobacteria bacterium]
MDRAISRRCFLASGSVATALLASPQSLLSLLVSDATAAVRLSALDPNVALPPVKVLQGLELKIAKEHVPIDRMTIVWGDTVELSGEIRTGGNPIIIVARRIEFLPGSQVDTVAYGTPTPDYPVGTRAGNGPRAGDPGGNGGASGHGGNAGDVLILADRIEGPVTVIAHGQRGGNARGGGDGAIGTIGPTATRSCTQGGQGGRGGKGGLAGTPGNGGNGGSVVLVSFEPDSLTISKVLVSPGDPGKPAPHGKSVKGGRGGAGGPADYTEIRHPCVR